MAKKVAIDARSYEQIASTRNIFLLGEETIRLLSDGGGGLMYVRRTRSPTDR